MFCDFFFQAEDGIRDGRVTGVQTCALPICSGWGAASWRRPHAHGSPCVASWRAWSDERAEQPQPRPTREVRRSAAGLVYRGLEARAPTGITTRADPVRIGEHTDLARLTALGGYAIGSLGPRANMLT